VRRVTAVAATLVVAVPLAVAVVHGGGEAAYRVNAVFDTAKGMAPGQLVKIAGARVGKVESVELVTRGDGYKARLTLEVDGRFGPFRADARCRILPEGLISENYVECDPGDPAQPPLAHDASGRATVPVQRTTVPLSVQDLLDVFAEPADQRLRIVLNELGLAFAGRGEDVNAILRRANPALAQARHALALVSAQRGQLTDAVGQTDAVLVELARRRRDVRAFVGRSAGVARTTAVHRDAVGRAIRDLPPMLAQARRGLRAVRRTTVSASPLLNHVHDAAPTLTRLTDTLTRFSRAGTPALRALGPAAADARTTLRALRPIAGQVRSLGGHAVPFGDHFGRVMSSTRDRGGWEGVVRTLYGLASYTSLFDGVSHIISLFVGVYPKCLVGGAAVPGCSHAYTAPMQGQVPVNDPAIAAAQDRALAGLTPRRERSPKRTRQARAPSHRAPAAGAPVRAPTEKPGRPPAPAVAPDVGKVADEVERALDGVLPGLRRSGGRSARAPAIPTVEPFLDYLLG
jgi:virulence factor Mce-like protein